MKSYVEEILRVYKHVLADVTYAYPSLEAEFSRDWDRLQSLAETRGMPLFAVDLVALGKHLDRCVAEGEYKHSGLPVSKPVSRMVQIPKLFRGLYLLMFDRQTMCLKENCDVQAYLFLRQLLLGAKKADIRCSQEAIDQEIDRFIQADASLPLPSIFWNDVGADLSVADCEVCGDGDGVPDRRSTFAQTMRYVSALRSKQLLRADRDGEEPPPMNRHLLSVLDTVSGIVVSRLGRFTPEDWRFKHGPGAVSDRKRGENRYQFINWSDRLETEFPYADCAFHNYAQWAVKIAYDEWLTRDGDFYPRVDESPVSKLIDVPKTLTKPRLIASEPSEQMWCQQNLSDYFHSTVSRSWLSDFLKFDDQTQNQEMVLAASLDGSLATLDLSDASNLVSCLAVECFFGSNPQLLRALAAARTHLCRLPHGEDLVLRKYAAMGNATTFPVESLIFLGIALSACLVHRGLSPTVSNVKALSGEVSIYGDDIIVPVECWGTIIQLLEVLDFKVNTDKSFGTGLFRESCGVDAFRGHDVSPAYWRSTFDGTPESYARTIDVSNNFYKRFLVSSSNYLRSTCDGKPIRFPVVPMDSGVSGWYSFVEPDDLRMKQRWNRRLQRKEFFTPGFQARVDKVPITDHTALLQFFTEQPNPFILWKGGVAQRPVLKIKNRWVSCSDIIAQDEQPHVTQLDLGQWRLPGDYTNSMAR